VNNRLCVPADLREPMGPVSRPAQPPGRTRSGRKWLTRPAGAAPGQPAVSPGIGTATGPGAPLPETRVRPYEERFGLTHVDYAAQRRTVNGCGGPCVADPRALGGQAPHGGLSPFSGRRPEPPAQRPHLPVIGASAFRHTAERRSGGSGPGTYAHRMEQSEVLKRVIGILTEAGEMQRHAEESTGGGDPDAGGSMVTTLLNETMPHIAIPSDATVEEMAVLVGREVGGAVEQLVGAFTLAFIALAQVHDSGQEDMTSADVLQDLALRAEELSSGDEGPEEGPL
jgi:hypothetical protein